MPEMTLAEKVARTRALHVELAAIWGDDMPTVAIHYLSHEVLHDCGYPSGAHWGGGHPFITASLGKYPFAPQIYARLDPTCEECRDLAVGLTPVNGSAAVETGVG